MHHQPGSQQCFFLQRTGCGKAVIISSKPYSRQEYIERGFIHQKKKTLLMGSNKK